MASTRVDAASVGFETSLNHKKKEVNHCNKDTKKVIHYGNKTILVNHCGM
jgi:hypothetical protein